MNAKISRVSVCPHVRECPLPLSDLMPPTSFLLNLCWPPYCHGDTPDTLPGAPLPFPFQKLSPQISAWLSPLTSFKSLVSCHLNRSCPDRPFYTEACLSTSTLPLLLVLFLFSVVLSPSNTLEILFICYVYDLLSASPHWKPRQGTWPILFTVVPQEPGSICNTQGAWNKHLLNICQINLLLNFTFFLLICSSLIK